MTLTRLPDLTLPRTTTGTPHPLRGRGREGTVLYLAHSARCAACAEYLQTLEAAQEQMADWDGRVLVVVPENGDAAASLQTDFPVLADPDGKVAQRCGLAGGGAMVIADQWGEVFFVAEGGEGVHELPAAAEVVEWLRFMAIQCPECQGEAL